MLHKFSKHKISIRALNAHNKAERSLGGAMREGGNTGGACESAVQATVAITRSITFVLVGPDLNRLCRSPR